MSEDLPKSKYEEGINGMVKEWLCADCDKRKDFLQWLNERHSLLSIGELFAVRKILDEVKDNAT